MTVQVGLDWFLLGNDATELKLLTPAVIQGLK